MKSVKKIKVGDNIIFANASNSNDTFTTVVKNLYHARNFDELCSIIRPNRAGFSSKEELLRVLEEFYKPAAQNKFGVVGIEIQKVF